ncbi:AlpA family phage regulatory protein [Sphingomonas sp. PL-96]|uniref:helix-turn-helix transcriptional regulator n=1 Tax=Sphingomonas sp. PL-96 TaxID=2887201 RepID=UPI001E2FB8FD|nr:AlpA family phage regulatory protein [Sphingomonas sp. PL-96]MCC2977954.1 AlpA family phage regulatory protein [Sphingomonas sp. PL-96]
MTESDRILGLNAVLDLTGLSRSTLYRKVADGSLPRQAQLSTRCVGWRTSAIAEWQRNPIFYRVDEANEPRLR